MKKCEVVPGSSRERNLYFLWCNLQGANFIGTSNDMTEQNIFFEISLVIWDYVFSWKGILDQKIRNTQLQGTPSPQYFQFNVNADKLEYQSES